MHCSIRINAEFLATTVLVCLTSVGQAVAQTAMAPTPRGAMASSNASRPS